MPNRVLLPTQKNQVFQSIQNIGLSPQEFDWKEIASLYLRDTAVSMLIHKPSSFYLKFEWRNTPAGTRPFFEYSPGIFASLEHEGPYPAFNIGIVQRWLTNLKREVETPDLWGTIDKESALIEGIPGAETGNAPFTQEEQKKIGVALNEIKAYLCQLQSFSGEQQRFIEANFNYLKDAASRVGRKDWKVILLGTLISTAVTLAMTPDNTHALLRFAVQIIRQVLSGVISLPLPH